MNNSWISKPVNLNFRLTGGVLFELVFPAKVLNAHFTALTTNPDETPLPLELLSPAAETLLIRSHPTESDLESLNISSKFFRYVPFQYTRYYVDLSGSFDDYLGKFSTKYRWQLKKKVKKFAELSGGEIEWRVYRRADQMEEFHRLAREVSKRTYQENLLQEGLPDGEEFLRELQAMAERDSVRGYLLFLEGRPVAYIYCPGQGDILYQGILGYNPEFQQWSPGMVLNYLSLESMFSENKRFRMLDFSEGEYEYKKQLSTGSARCAEIYYFRPTFRNLILIGFHHGWVSSVKLALRALDYLKLKDRVKKLLRSRSQA